MTAYCKSELGTAAAEYVLILAVIGAGIAGAALEFGDAMSAALSAAGSMMAGVQW